MRTSSASPALISNQCIRMPHITRSLWKLAVCITMRTPFQFKSLKQVVEQSTFRNVKRDMLHPKLLSTKQDNCGHFIYLLLLRTFSLKLTSILDIIEHFKKGNYTDVKHIICMMLFLAASTRFDSRVFINPAHNISIVITIKYTDGTQRRGDTTGSWHCRVNQVQEVLKSGMVRGRQGSVEDRWTVTRALICIKTGRGNDEIIVPINSIKVDGQWLPATGTACCSHGKILWNIKQNKRY